MGKEQKRPAGFDLYRIYNYIKHVLGLEIAVASGQILICAYPKLEWIILLKKLKKIDC